MHEEPYAQAMLDMAVEKADGKTITEIVLKVGRFSAVDPKSLEMFFLYLSRGTIAQEAKLIFEIVPVTLLCKACHQTTTIPLDIIPIDKPIQPILVHYLKKGCSFCGSEKLSVSDGLTVEMANFKHF